MLTIGRHAKVLASKTNKGRNMNTVQPSLKNAAAWGDPQQKAVIPPSVMPTETYQEVPNNELQQHRAYVQPMV
jgi:hypothetical protein